MNDSRGNKTIAYQYSPGGRLTRMTIDDVGPIDYRYDQTGKLATIWDPFDTIVFYQYEALRLKQRLLANGTAAEYTWNLDGTLVQLKNGFTNAQGVQSIVTQHDYLYNGVGQRSQGTDKVGFFSQPAANEAFAYDAVHNRTQRTASGLDQRFGFDGANQLIEIRDGLASNALVGALVYDANGNLKKKCTGAGVSGTQSDCTGSNVLTLTFDAANRLTQAIGPNGIETYGYDDQGRRIRKTVNGVNTFYLYNGQDIVAEYGDGWAKPIAITLHGAGTDDPIARYTRNGSGTFDKAYYHADGLGSVVALTKDDGTITGAQMFDSWGAKIATSSIGTVPAYGYTGREPDATGLIYYRARYYDAAIGRFVSQDPIGMEGGLNYYAYVDNNPVNLADPSGMTPFAWVVKLLDNGGRMIVRTLSSKPEAVQARRQGENVVVSRRQAARQVEDAANGGSRDIVRHPGHELNDASIGLPHYQTPGKPGHTFYGDPRIAAAAAATGMAASATPESSEAASGDGILGTNITWRDVGEFVIDLIVAPSTAEAPTMDLIARPNPEVSQAAVRRIDNLQSMRDAAPMAPYSSPNFEFQITRSK